jgi:hypothetical protein
MNDKGIRRWALLGALVSTALLTPACDRKLPQTGGEYEGVANEAQKNEQLPNPNAQPQDTQQPATGGAGLQGQDDQQPIGAPGYSDPRELPQSDQGYSEPMPGKAEPGGADKEGEKDRQPIPNQ